MADNKNLQILSYGRIRAAMVSMLAAMLVVIVSLGLYGRAQLNRLNEANTSLQYTYNVTNHLHGILEFIVDTDIALDCYAITGNKHCLERYQASVLKVNESVKQLGQLLSNDPEQLKQLAELEKSIAAKFSILQKAADASRVSGVEAAHLQIISESNVKEMEKIRRIKSAMINHANQLFAMHTAEQTRQAENASLGLFLICVAAMLFQIVMGLIIRSFVRGQRAAERALRENHELNEYLFSGIRDYALYLLDPHGKVMTWNTPSQKINGYAPEEIIGKHYSCFYTAADQSKGIPMNQLETALNTGRCEADGQHVRKDGSRFWASVVITPVYRHSGELMGFAGVTRDITEKREADRRVSEFYSIVSHELRTPLTSIRGTLGLMDAGRLGELVPQTKNLVSLALSETERLNRLINDILDIRKIESGKLELQTRQLVPSEIVASTLESMESTAHKASIKLTSQVDTADKIFGDRDRVTQILINLISNAIKFSPSGAEVVVRIENTAAGVVRFSVIDHGPGIPREQLYKLFGKFQQLDSSDTRAHGGTGLGLAISKALVEQSGGAIGVDTDVGQGSTFWFEMSSEPGVIISKLHDWQHKILFVIDDHGLCERLAEPLGQEGFEIVETSTIKGAEEYLAGDLIPAAIMLDVLLSDGNGLDFLTWLRRNTKTENIPVVMLSKHDPALGTYSHPLVVDWIKKPLDEQQLLGSLHLAVRLRHPGRPRVLVVESDKATLGLIEHDLKSFDVEYFSAADGIEAINLARKYEPDLIILDLSVGAVDEFAVVEILRRERSKSVPLILYTARELDDKEKQMLTLGLTAHLTKSRTSEQDFLNTIRNLLDGLLKVNNADHAGVAH